MGLCFSKKQQVRRRREEQQQPPCHEARKAGGGKKAGAKEVAIVPEAAKKAPPPRKAVPKAEEPAADKRTVFVVKAAAAAAAAEVAASASGEAADEEAKRPAPEEEEAKPVVVSRVPVRTSSCTKEEVDAILIQCGRLSRSSSSSGKVASGEGGGGHRRYSGSKRSYDFDRERRGGGGGGVDDDCDWERQGAAVSRPSPRRRTPERKRSGSHERSGGSGSRRVSRSPGRRADSVPATASGERASRQQPGKMVSVPAREKGRAPSPVPAASGKRYPSPRSNSPARAGAAGNENAAAQLAHGPSLSRSSSRKAEHSPYRRNPMAELDENTLGNHHSCNNNGRPQKKPTESGGALPQKVAEWAKDQVAASRTAAKEKQEIVEVPVASSDTKGGNSGRMKATHSVSIVAESVVNQKGRSSRRSSHDFDNNGNSYASLLLEDIQNYHQQSTGSAAAPAPAFSLPACVSKACSILEAVADLNSSSSENKSFELDRSANDKCSANGRYGDGKVAGGGTLVVESEVVVKDDLMEPSLHKYVSVRDIRGEAEPQESAGSNSFAGNAWTPSWEPSSVDSTDRTWTASQSNNGDEVEQLSSGAVSPLELSWQGKQKLPSQEPSGGGRSRVGPTGNAQRGRSAHRGGGGAVNARSDVRAAPVSSSIA
ncbi:uncharacterized protein At1g65710 [Oryza sativa Japonica Group]|uniref:Os04g0528600 protein n=2 Tax=Oryza sativa subsp. japonica TaxID=39947 RepID=Q7XUM1_ORYSJ|nr:uncharacterized protein At1g65710 [Oryza sativa Japonica Group]KAF2935041.1 hypothetical protein DAI22_04g203700 [Oryza sativa Japonica Group]BAS90187.1 Os04g0528600 [Oryza sativa Japonica Group]CAD41196.2 OSJNBa0074L08.7 [Oryza sativa Japonica Group]